VRKERARARARARAGARARVAPAATRSVLQRKTTIAQQASAIRVQQRAVIAASRKTKRIAVRQQVVLDPARNVPTETRAGDARRAESAIRAGLGATTKAATRSHGVAIEAEKKVTTKTKNAAKTAAAEGAVATRVATRVATKVATKVAARAVTKVVTRAEAKAEVRAETKAVIGAVIEAGNAAAAAAALVAATGNAPGAEAAVVFAAAATKEKVAAAKVTEKTDNGVSGTFAAHAKRTTVRIVTLTLMRLNK